MPTYRQYLITRVGAQHIRQEADNSWVQYFTGDEISIADEDKPNDFAKWGNLGLRLLVSTPTKAPIVTKTGTAVGLGINNEPQAQKIKFEFDPKTGIDLSADDGPDQSIAQSNDPLGVKKFADSPEVDLFAEAAKNRADQLEKLLSSGEATNGAQEFNAWRATVVDSGLLGDASVVPTTKAGILQALANAQQAV